MSSGDPTDSLKREGQRRVLADVIRLRVWITERFKPSEQQGNLVWAGIIGFCGALVGLAFRKSSEFVHWLFTGHYGGYVESFAHLSWWQRLIIPTLGGLCAGSILLLRRRLKSVKGGGDYMEAIALGDGQVSFRASLVQSGSALFSIASGASIGREGPLVQLAAMAASVVGRWRKIPTVRLRLYVACGAAAGIASVYNAPIAGALFVSEIILKSIAMETFGPLVFASVVATLTSRNFVGSDALYQISVPSFTAPTGFDVIPYLLLGLLAGTVAPFFLYLLRLAKDVFGHLAWPLPCKLAVGGILLGALAVIHPEVCGNGYSVISAVLHGKWVAEALIFVLFFKLAATAISFGSGAVGGIFTPTLFVGACMGFVFASGMHEWFGLSTVPEAFTLVGMGALLAATTQAPLMAIILIFEMSLDYDIILPLMAACVLAYYVARTFSICGVYAESIKAAENESYEKRLAAGRALQLLKPDPPTVRVVTPFSDIAKAFVAHRINYLYVVEEDNRFCGAISLHDVKEYLNDDALSKHVIADDLVRRDFPVIFPKTSFAEAMASFSHLHGDRLPVVLSDKTPTLIGSISKNDLILALVERKSTGIPEAETAAQSR